MTPQRAVRINLSFNGLMAVTIVCFLVHPIKVF